jgi:hypothetical protein
MTDSELEYFYTDDILRKRGLLKSFKDVERVISLGKPATVVDKFIEEALAARQWDWFDSVAVYEEELAAVELWNTSNAGEISHVVTHREYEGETVTLREETIYHEARELPVAPVRPLVETPAEWRATSLSPVSAKMAGVEIEGVMCSATAEDMWGLSAIESYVRAGIDTKFKFANGGVLTLTSASIDAFREIWVPFRASFFN